MIEQYIRSYYQSILVDPIISKVHRIFTPISITLLSFIIGILVLPAIYYQHSALAICLLLLSGYLDTLDGTLARYVNDATPLGSIYDIMSDRAVEFAVILGLWIIDPINRALLCLLMLGSILLCVTSFLIVGIFTPNDSHKGFHYSPGIMERAEAFLFFILMILLPAYFSLLSIIFISLVMLTTFIRLREFHS